MTGREIKESNDLFFVCSIIESISRETNNHRSVVVNAIGRDKLQHVYHLADVYHNENLKKVSDELISICHISKGSFDNVATCSYTVPTIWDIGKVYKRLILDVAKHRDTTDFVDVLIDIYNSWISRKIEDYNSSMYFENSDYLFQSYLVGDILP